MRNKKHCSERMERCSSIWIKKPSEFRGKWHKEFGNDNPIHIEIGCGKGNFILGMARQNPDINYIAVEKVKSVLVIAMEKIYGENIGNVRFLSEDARVLGDFFEKGEIERVYLNFSDPWPKSKTAKRRLTHKDFLDIYRRILPEHGCICFKTDNKGLFEFSLNSFADNKLRLHNITFDLHTSGFKNNVMTEYEEKFVSEGMPIYRAEAFIN